jgi:UDP-N-acetyl-D-glucosamine dehydrogenase
VVGVIGMGYVGLPLAQHLCEAGFRVVGFDIDQKKVSELRQGRSYIRHISGDWLKEACSTDRFAATTDFSRLAEVDCVSICVPTPLNKHRDPDLVFVEGSAHEIGRYLRPGQLVILESTTYPGTTAELVLPELSATGLRIGEDFFLAFSPEREDPGNERHTIKTIPKVVGGVTPQCTSLAAEYYESIFKEVVRVDSPAIAEMSKLLENIFRSVNIALVNELKMLCNQMEIDIWKVIEAASTKPFGFMPFYPGPGLGGHCIPIDPFYLTWKAREYGITTRFIELSGEINTSMPRYVVGRVMEALNAHGKSLKGSRVLVLGAAYKKDVDDLRESPSLELIRLLQKQGAEVAYNDPYVPRLPLSGSNGLAMESTEMSAEVLQECDCLLVSTAHSCYDAQFIVDHAPLIVDTRNFVVHAACPSGKIVKA